MSEDDDIADASAADALVVRPPHCEHCGKTEGEFVELWESRGATQLPVRLIEMRPGPDGKAWHLCVECHVPGKVDRPIGEQSPPPPTQPKAVKVTRPRAPRKPKATAQH